MPWLRRYRAVYAAFCTAVLALAFVTQSGAVCHTTHAHGAMAMHQHDMAVQAPCDHPRDAARAPLCCWALATCASPAAPAARADAGAEVVTQQDVPAAAIAKPRSLVFAPETPPPRA
jgi:hypothetical protein